MKRFLQKLPASWLWRSETIAVVSTIALSTLFVKPASITTAGTPRVIAAAGPQQKATAPARVEQREEQVRQIRPETYDVSRFPVTNANEKHWRNILWTTAVVQPQEPFVADALDQILSLMTRSQLSQAQMRTIDAAAQVGTQLYLSNPSLYRKLGDRFAQAITQSPDPEWVAMSLSALAKVGIAAEQLQPLAQRVKQRFPSWASNVFLSTTIRDVAESLNPPAPPPLKDLLNWTIAPNQLHLYVICQPDRYVLCQTVLKDRTGQFVRNRNGQLWSVPLLLRSLHNLSWNFVRGQTPQGIYRIEGEVPQPDDEFFRAYGQFPLVNLFVPFEPGVKQFIPGKPGTFNGSITAYQDLLPPSWRNHWSLQQSYWAGKAGRSEFRVHGSGESPDFFSGKDRNPATYNWNPTIGCLSALELYDERGQLVTADMPKILGALEQVGGKNFSGYLVVVEAPAPPGQPVPLPQIEAALRKGSVSLSVKRSSKAGSLKRTAHPSKPAIVAKPKQPIAIAVTPASVPHKAVETLNSQDFHPATHPLPIAY